MTNAELRAKYSIEPSKLSRFEMRRVLLESCEWWVINTDKGIVFCNSTDKIKKAIIEDLVNIHQMLSEDGDVH